MNPCIKTAHESPGAATKELQHMARNQVKDMTIYKCRYCGKWHVGHKRKSKKQENKDERRCN